MICSSVCLLRFIVRPFWRPDSNSTWRKSETHKSDSMSASLQKRLKCCIAAKGRDGASRVASLRTAEKQRAFSPSDHREVGHTCQLGRGTLARNCSRHEPIGDATNGNRHWKTEAYIRASRRAVRIAARGTRGGFRM